MIFPDSSSVHRWKIFTGREIICFTFTTMVMNSDAYMLSYDEEEEEVSESEDEDD